MEESASCSWLADFLDDGESSENIIVLEPPLQHY